MEIKGEEQVLSLGRWAIWCGTGVIGLFFLLTTTCTMHSNAYEADVINAQAVLTKERLLITKERLAAVERLVDKGIHPVVARCSITTSFKSEKCATIVPKLNVMMDEQNESK